jgi:hypothetical protein
MKRLALMWAVLLTATAGILCSLGPAPASAAPVVVQECYVIPPGPLSKKPKGTAIQYVNKGRHTATSVTFAVGYRNSLHHYLRRVTDVGSFAPGAQIKHTFSLYNDVTYAGEQTHGCAPISVSFKNGMKWLR